MKVRCMLCGKMFEEEAAPPVDPYDDDYEDERKKKPMVVCLMCQAKLKHEADNSQKLPKPM